MWPRPGQNCLRSHCGVRMSQLGGRSRTFWSLCCSAPCLLGVSVSRSFVVGIVSRDFFFFLQARTSNLLSALHHRRNMSVIAIEKLKMAGNNSITYLGHFDLCGVDLKKQLTGIEGAGWKTEEFRESSCARGLAKFTLPEPSHGQGDC